MSAETSDFAVTRLAHRFGRDTRGAAAAEFAIILPVMLALAFGASEVSNLIAIDRKLNVTARALSDIVAQSSAISNEEMQNVLKAGTVMLQPYPDKNLKLRVSAVDIDDKGKATVKWSDALPPSEARSPTAVTIPPALLIPNTQLIWGEVSYDYEPGAGSFSLKPKWSIPYEKNELFARPRGASGVVCRPTCS